VVVVGRVAVVRSVWRYPVKSMAGEELSESELTFQGLPGDRRYAFVQAESRSPFPWLTGRQVADLLCYRPAFDGATPRPRLHVTTPAGATHPVGDPALQAELTDRFGKPLFLLQDYRGIYDVAPVSLIGLGTVRRIGVETGTPAEPRRFRANLYVEPDGGAAFAEDDWVGRVLRIGETARLAVQEPDPRCAMVNLDPDGGPANPAVLTYIAQQRATMAGVYGVVLTPGVVRPGDVIAVE
jgi:uncharacterized protein